MVNERPIRAPSPVDFELVSRSVHRVCVRARERRTRGRERRKKSRRVHAQARREPRICERRRERGLAMAEEKKKKRDEFASRLDCPPTLGGKGVKEKDRKRGTTC